TVTGYRGRSVQIKCPYESGYEENNKYLCRGECPHLPGNRDVPVQSGSPKDTRFSLYDNTTAKIFTVTITDLRAEDANTYWCGIEQPGIDKFTKIQLVIMAGSDAVTTVTGYRGRSVQIKCPYESGYEENNKYLCRGECPPWPAIKDIPVQSGSPAEDTRFSLYDNTRAKIFTVTITDLRAEDANTYWCGIEQPGIDKYTDIQLVIMDVPPSSTVSQSTRTTYSASTHPSVHPETHPATGKNIFSSSSST
ncbi:CMRF35-like molecule 8, partial [Silurus meridionalis]